MMKVDSKLEQCKTAGLQMVQILRNEGLGQLPGKLRAENTDWIVGKGGYQYQLRPCDQLQK